MLNRTCRVPSAVPRRGRPLARRTPFRDSQARLAIPHYHGSRQAQGGACGSEPEVAYEPARFAQAYPKTPLPSDQPRTTGSLSVLSTGIGPPGRRWVKAPPDSMVVGVVHPGWRFSPRFRPGLFFCWGRAMKLVTTPRVGFAGNRTGNLSPEVLTLAAM